VEVGRRLCGCVRDADMVARLGGDEFTLLLEGVEDARQAEQVAGRALECLQAPLYLDGYEIRTSASIGIALSGQGEGNDTPDDLLRSADMAMYTAKGQGKGRCMTFTPCIGAHMRRQFQTDLRLRLTRGEDAATAPITAPVTAPACPPDPTAVGR
jgi:predicted signal transduction protein with EAL and GGDEF domain